MVPDDSLWFALMLRTVWPVKAEAALLQFSPATADRTARAYKRGDRMPSATVLRDLVRGDEGYIILTAIMATDPPTWWVNLQAELQFAAKCRAFHREVTEQLRG